MQNNHTILAENIFLKSQLAIAQERESAAQEKIVSFEKRLEQYAQAYDTFAMKLKNPYITSPQYLKSWSNVVK